MLDAAAQTSPARGDPPVEALLRRARNGLQRLAPVQVPAALDAGAVLIDIRSDLQRLRDGELPRAVVVARNVLEWRCDPLSEWRDPGLADVRRRLILICDEGYQSSLAAATLQLLGRADATDVIGGFRGWRAAGMPVLASGARVRAIR